MSQLRQKAGKNPMNPFKDGLVGEIPLCLREGQPLCSIQAFNCLDGAHPYGRGVICFIESA